MRKSNLFRIGLVIFFLCAQPLRAHAANPYVASYKTYLTLAQEALHKGRLRESIFYLEVASAIDPSQDEPRRLINYVRRLQDGQVVSVEAQPKAKPVLARYTPPYSETPVLNPYTPSIETRTPVLQKALYEGKLHEKTVIIQEPPRKWIPATALRVTRETIPLSVEVISPSRLSAPEEEQRRVSAPTGVIPKVEFTKKVSEVPRAYPSVIQSTISARPSTAGQRSLTALAAETTRPGTAPYYVMEGQVFLPEPGQQPRPIPTQGTVFLNDDLWQKQPNTPLIIEVGKFLMIEGSEIKRFLMTTEGVFQVEQEGLNRLKITAIKYGSSFFHLWDERGRWTFNVKSILPQPSKKSQAYGQWGTLEEEWVNPFKVVYSTSWSSYYRGNSFPNLKRNNLTYQQWVGMYGDTPYGEFDASLNWYKYQTSTELVGQAVGLTHGRIGNFEDFTIRGYDTWKKFSDLSLPGRSIRGFLWESYAFDRNLLYTYLRGKDRASYFYYGPGNFKVKESFVEGGRVVLFPERERQFAVNYATGWGPARPDFLKDHVYSVETSNSVPGFNSYYEYAYDTSEYGQQAYATWERPKTSLTIAARDLPKDFYTINDQPIGQGEAGGKVSFNWRPDASSRLWTSLDIYRNRKEGDPDNWNNVNVESETSLVTPIDERSNWQSSFFYDYTPQLLNPRNNMLFSNSYNRLYHIFGNRDLSLFAGQAFQFARFPESPTSDYNRSSLRAGFRLPLFKRLAYYAQYEYSWVEDVNHDQKDQPSVMTMGLNYSREFVKSLSTNLSVTYRDEQNTQNSFSFLSGEDSVRGTWGLSYTPSPDLQLYVDGELSDIWAENPSNSAYNEASIRFGVQTAWNSPFHWNPTGTVKGVIFKDTNGNGMQDASESGAPGVIVRVGRKEAVTDSQGQYQLKISAKRVRVTPDIDSIPKGFIFSTPVTQNVDITEGRVSTVNFGLTTRSAIHGIVFFDDNGNGQQEIGEKGIPLVEIILDQEKKALTDFEGVYSFDNLSVGIHSVRININSLPLQYLPRIRVQNEIEIEEGTTYVFPIPLKMKAQ